MLRERRLELGDLGVERGDEGHRRAGDEPMGLGDQFGGLELRCAEGLLDLLCSALDVALAPALAQCRGDFRTRQSPAELGGGSDLEYRQRVVAGQVVAEGHQGPG